jgi:hypothetical protein
LPIPIVLAQTTMVGFTLLLALIGACAIAWVVNARQKKSHPFPPGPPADFLIGHTRLIPSEKQDWTFYELGKTYGGYCYQEKPLEQSDYSLVE